MSPRPLPIDAYMGMGNLPANFGVSRTFRSRLIGQHLSDASRDLAILTFIIAIMTKAAKRLWFLAKLKRAGVCINIDDLVHITKAL